MKVHPRGIALVCARVVPGLLYAGLRSRPVWLGMVVLVLAACREPAPAPDAGRDGDARCAGCFVGHVCHPDGAANPANPCEVCDGSSASFRPANGARCDDGLFCTIDDVCSGGVCVGTARACSDGIACNGSETCDEGAHACVAGTRVCGERELCDAVRGECVSVSACPGCAIGGACYGDGQVDPLDACRVCDVDASRTGWSPNDGARCDDGLFCTIDDVCTGTVCGGAARACGDGIACNGAETCDEAADACAGGISRCAEGQVCDVVTGACTAICTGCVIGGTCYGTGQVNAANACEVCAPAVSRSGWSPNDGARCDDGLFCTIDDVCSAGRCMRGAARACGDGIACNGAETCDEAADRCRPATPTCGAGTVCDTPTDRCVASCGGGTTSCSGACVDTDHDPTHCGGCGVGCSAAPNASPVCVEGDCRTACDPGFGDCTSGPGCETDTQTSLAHCGGCGNGCGPVPNASPVCVGGACRAVCGPGFLDCTSDLGCETDPRTSSAHCGGCGRACGVSQACIESTCVDIIVPGSTAPLSRDGWSVRCADWWPGGPFCVRPQIRVECTTCGAYAACGQWHDLVFMHTPGWLFCRMATGNSVERWPPPVGVTVGGAVAPRACGVRIPHPDCEAGRATYPRSGSGFELGEAACGLVGVSIQRMVVGCEGWWSGAWPEG